jgi:hypothetical protein
MPKIYNKLLEELSKYKTFQELLAINYTQKKFAQEYEAIQVFLLKL